MIKKWLKERKQFIIAAVVFSLFGTGVTFALPYLPSDAELDPTCAPGDADCYVNILTPWDTIGDPTTDGSISFGETEQVMRWANFTNALDGITFYFDNNGGTANTDSGMILANEYSTATSGDLNTENLLLIKQIDDTTFGTTVVDNFLKIDVAANSGGIDGIEITNSAGNLTNGINLVDTAGGTFTTGIVFSGTFTNAIDTGTTTLSLTELDVLDAGIELGDLTTQGTATDEFCLTSETGGGALLAWQSCDGLTVGTSTISSGTAGGVLFEGTGNVLQEDATNFSWDDTANQLFAKYLKADSTEYQNSSFMKSANQTANSYLSVFIGRGFGSGGAAQTTTSTPSSGINDYGGIAIGENIMSTTTTVTAFTGSILLGTDILTTAQTDGSLNIAMGTAIGGTSQQNQGVYIGGGILGSSTATNGYNDSFGHQNVAIGRNALNRANQGRNTAVGTLALARLADGYRNTAIGKGAGNGSGTSPASALNATYTTFLGADTNFSLNNITNSTAVGYGVTLDQSNTVILGNNANVGIGDTTPSALFTVGSGDLFQIDTGGNFLTTANATTGNVGLITASSLTTGDGLEINSSSLTSGSLLNLVSNGTAADGQAGLVINLSGANATTNKNSFGAWIENTHTNSGNNYGLYVSVTGGQGNVAASFNNGTVGIGTMSPTALLDVTGASVNGATLVLNSTSGNNLLKINAPSANESGILIQDNGTTSWEIIRDSSSTNLSIWGTSLHALTIAQTGVITIGESDTTGNLFVLDDKTGAGDPTGINGGMYYNSNANKFRCYENTAWTNCIGASSSGAISGLTAATGTNTIDNTNYAQQWDWSTLSTQNGLTMTANALSSGSLLNLTSTSTAAASNTQKLLNVSLSGANATASQTTYAGYFSNTHTGTTGVNTALYAVASGGYQNAAIGVEGDIYAYDNLIIKSEVGGGTNGYVNINSDTTSIETNGNVWLSGGNTLDTTISTVNDDLDILISPRGTGKFGIADATPAALFTVGSGDLFQIDGSGNFLTTASATTGNAGLITANSLTSGKALSVTSSATAFTGNIANFTLSGSNAANTGAVVQIDNTGTLSTNTGFLINHYATGTGNLAMRVNDVSGDTTPFVINGVGSVGIGTDNPRAQLEIDGAVLGSYGQIFVDDSSGTSSVFMKTNASTANSNGIGFMNNGVNGWELYRIGGTSNLNFNDGANDVMTLENGGEVGINDTTPDYTLDVEGTFYAQSVATGDDLRFAQDSSVNIDFISGGNIDYNTVTGAEHTFKINTAQVLKIDDNGNVAVGSVVAPTVKFQVAGDIRISSSAETITTSTSSTSPGVGDAGLYMGYDATNDKAFIRSVKWLTSMEPLYVQAGEFRVVTGAGTLAEAMVVDSAGKVGIGDTTPDGLLDLDSSATTGINFGITNTGVYTGTGLFSVVANSATTGVVGVMTANGLSSGSLLSLTSTSTAAASNTQKLLNIALSGANSTSTQTTYGAYISNTHTGTSSTNVGLYVNASGGTNNYPALFAGGAVGIGTAAPSRLLTIGASNGIEGVLIENGDVDGGGEYRINDSVNGHQGSFFLVSDNYSYGTIAGGDLGLYLTAGNISILNDSGNFNVTTGGLATPVFLIDAAGEVGIGDTTPDFKLDVETDVATFVANIFNDGNATTRSGLLIQGGLDDHTAAGPSTLIEFRDGDGGTVGSITFGSSVTAYNTTSDQRLKENIQDSTLTILDLMNIKIHDYTWIADSNHLLSRGVLAQELYEVYPIAVTKPIDEATGTWMVDYSKLTPLIIKSIQDLKLSSDLNFELLSNVDTSVANSFGNKVKNILADAQNGVIDLYAKNINSDRIKTKELCVGDVCINEAQFLQMVQFTGVNNQQQNSPSPNVNPDPAPEPNPDPIPEDNTNPEPEIVPEEPAPEPTPEPETVPEPTPEIPIENNP